MVVEFIPSLLWLLIVSFSFGFALTREKSLTTFGFGLAAFAVLSIIFNLIGIPLNWLVFLAIALGLLAYFIYRKELELKVEKPDRVLLAVLIMAAINIQIYWNGANAYPYLEDDDPWNHAVGTKWVAETESYSRHYDGEHFYRLYIEPYPPVYDVLMGVIHQMTESVSSTLKFFNAFLVGTALVMAFFVIEELTKNRKIALFSAFFLLSMPAFMGHFIWAQTLAMLFLFVAFYAMERSLQDKRFVLPTGVAIGAIAITQPSVAVTFILMAGLYLAAKFYRDGKSILKPLVMAGSIGILITILFYVPVYLKYGPEDFTYGVGIFQGLFDPESAIDTSGGLVYSPQDYLFVSPQGKIDQHIGIGVVLSILVLAGTVLAIKDFISGKREAWIIISILWLLLGILGTEGNALPVKLFPHRFWVFLAIPVAMLASSAYLRLEEKFQKHQKYLLAILIISVFTTSAVGKLEVQTATWPPGAGFSSMEEISGYVQMGTMLPKNTKVFPLCSFDSKIIGFDMLSEPYVPEYGLFKHDALNKSPEEVHSFISSRGYSYLTIDPTCVTELGPEGTNALVSSYLSSESYEQVYSNKAFILLRVK